MNRNMKKLLMILTVAAACSNLAAQSKFPTETFRTEGGRSVVLHCIKHGSVAIEVKGDRSCMILVDPVGDMYGEKIDYSVLPMADAVFVTHEHGDHLHPATVAARAGKGAQVFANGTSARQLEGARVLANGDEVTLAAGIKVLAVPAYNTTEGRERFHPKGNGNGYVFDIDGFVVYVAGDTESIPEMAQLKGKVDVAFLPVNQPYTMTPEQCREAARLIRPKLTIPYHLSQTDFEALKACLQGEFDYHLYEELR